MVLQLVGIIRPNRCHLVYNMAIMNTGLYAYLCLPIQSIEAYTIASYRYSKVRPGSANVRQCTIGFNEKVSTCRRGANGCTSGLSLPSAVSLLVFYMLIRLKFIYPLPLFSHYRYPAAPCRPIVSVGKQLTVNSSPVKEIILGGAGITPGSYCIFGWGVIQTRRGAP